MSLSTAATRSHSSADAEREAQILEARRMANDEDVPAQRRVLTLRPSTQQRPSRAVTAAVKPRPQLKGHEAFLKALECSNATVVLEKCDGKVYTGQIKHSDHYTVTMRTEGRDRVIFKHDISEFHTTTPRQADDAATEEGHAV